MIKIIEELPKLTIESVLQGNYLFIPEETPKYHDKTSSYKNRAEERKKTFLELLKLAKGMEEMYDHPPTVPQLIELYAKHKEELDPFTLRKMSTVTSTAERFIEMFTKMRIYEPKDREFRYVVSHGDAQVERLYRIDPEDLWAFHDWKNLRHINPSHTSIEEMFSSLPETPKIGITYVIEMETPEIEKYKPYIDLARVGYKSTLENVKKLSKERIEMTIIRPVPTYHNGRPILAQTIFGEEEIIYSFFPEEPVSLLLPKKQK